MKKPKRVVLGVGMLVRRGIGSSVYSVVPMETSMEYSEWLEPDNTKGQRVRLVAEILPAPNSRGRGKAK